MDKILTEHHRQIASAIADLWEIIEHTSPDLDRLAVARLRLSRASRLRTKYIQEVLLPVERTTADSARLEALSALQQNFSAKRLAANEKVTTWSSRAIASDWDGYRRDAKRVWAMIDDHMTLERQLFGQ